jgi:hypothetical protein
MQELPVSNPETVFQWEAFRELHRHDLHTLDIEVLYALYGFSILPEYRDEACLRAIEDVMDRSADPVRFRYEMACMLGNYFDGDHFLWSTLNIGTPGQRSVLPDEPCYISPIPQKLHTIVDNWVCDGIAAFGIGDPQFHQVRNIAARFAGGSTFLTETDIARFCEVSGNPLDWRTDPSAQERIARAVEAMSRLANESREDGNE